MKFKQKNSFITKNHSSNRLFDYKIMQVQNICQVNNRATTLLIKTKLCWRIFLESCLENGYDRLGMKPPKLHVGSDPRPIKQAIAWQYFLSRLKSLEPHARKGECTSHSLLAADCLSSIRKHLRLAIEWLLDTREHLLLNIDYLSAIKEIS